LIFIIIFYRFLRIAVIFCHKKSIKDSFSEHIWTFYETIIVDYLFIPYNKRIIKINLKRQNS